MTDLSGLSKNARLAVADAMVEALDGHPFASGPKRRLDIALFTGLANAGAIDVRRDEFALARQLGITPARVRGFVYEYRLAHGGPTQDLDILLDGVRVVSLDPDGDVVLNVANSYDRDVLKARLKEFGVYTDTSFNRERMTLPAKRFLDVVDDAFGNPGGEVAGDVEALVKKARAKEVRGAVLGYVKGLADTAINTTVRALFQHAGVL